jgi:hypothetical protein
LQPVPAGVPLANALTVEEGATLKINEFFVEFAMTQRQVDDEETQGMSMMNGHGMSTGITLATRAANILAQVEDTVIFQGANARQTPFFRNAPANVKNALEDLGLLNIRLQAGIAPPPGIPQLPQNQVIPVAQAAPFPPPVPAGVYYQEETVAALAQGYSQLQANGHYGPYALVLHTFSICGRSPSTANDAHYTASPIRALVTAGFYGSGTLPPWTNGSGLPLPVNAGRPVSYTGVLVSLGGNTMDLVRAGWDRTWT